MFILSPASHQSASQVLIPNYISIFFVISCYYFLVETWRLKGNDFILLFVYPYGCNGNAKMIKDRIVNSQVENQNDLKLDFKIFSSLILVVQALYLMNPTDATLASLSVLKY